MTEVVIYRSSITKPDGTVLYASQFGKKAFRIVLSDKSDREKQDDQKPN